MGGWGVCTGLDLGPGWCEKVVGKRSEALVPELGKVSRGEKEME